VAAVARVVRSGVEAVAAVSSGSAALELALRALGIGPGQEVIIPTYACDALHHAVRRCRADPVLADADPVTLSVDPEDARRRRTRRTGAVVVPHAFGLAVDLEPFRALGVPVVEDCAQALGVDVGGRAVGSLGDLAVCSFYATKLLTTGEGGAVAGPAPLVARVRDGREYDEREDLADRFNYKLTDLQAALGRSQLGRLAEFLARRRRVAARYRVRLAGLPLELPPDRAGAHAYHRFVVVLDRPVEPVMAHLARRGVGARRPVFRPLHRPLGLAGYPVADRLWARALSLPCYPALTEEEVDRVAGALREALSG
jgi:dTDP-4-amino-4,6-dideoxygalactose transaminase